MARLYTINHVFALGSYWLCDLKPASFSTDRKDAIWVSKRMANKVIEDYLDGFRKLKDKPTEGQLQRIRDQFRIIEKS